MFGCNEMKKRIILGCFVMSTFYENFVNCKQKNNVCKNMMDYLTINNNTNCWYNPDIGATMSDIVQRNGYPLETYEIITDDGYINKIFRIPHNYTDRNMRKRQPILLRIGFSSNPENFFVKGNRSLPFHLVNQGFDVWLAVRRGSALTKGHVKYLREDKEFWNYSFHECGLYDIKAETEFIHLKNNSTRKIIMIGHSMATTEMLIYAILRKDHARQHVQGMILLCPVAFMGQSGGIVAKLSNFTPLAKIILKLYNVNSLYNEGEIRDAPVISSLPKVVLAKYFLMFINGYETEQFEPETVPVYAGLRSTSTSLKTLIHFSQEVEAGGNFQHFDYGMLKNLMLYNSIKPPAYDLTEIELPVYLFYGEGDPVAHADDVLRLYNSLNVTEKFIMSVGGDNNVKFTHADFILAKDIEELLYKKIINIINERFRAK